MIEINDAQRSVKELLRKAQKLMGLPDLAPIAFKHLCLGKNHYLNPIEETVVSLEHALFEYGYAMAFQVLARHAIQTSAKAEIWQYLARAAAALDLDERQTELLRRGLKQEMPEPLNRVYRHLNFEQLLRLAMKEMRLPEKRFSKARQMEGLCPNDLFEAVVWKFEDFWQSPALNGAWNVLAEFATKMSTSHICWELLAEAAKFLTLTDEQSEMLRRGIVGVDAPQ